ncbi:MAG: transcription antitermination factor NusB [Chitinophagales bacterium]|nr:transcription antitermination factor NusB [Chitinophagales bacterium]
MLGRRNLRVKVMQALYGWELDREVPLQKLEGLLRTQTEKSVALFLTNLLYLVEVCNYSMVDKAKRLAKYIKTEDDLNASTTVAANAIVQYLQNDTAFQEMLRKQGIRNYVNEGVVKKMFTDLAAIPEYKTYSATAQPTVEQDREIVITILRDIMSRSKELEQQLEETFPNLDDDQSLLLHIISKYTEEFTPAKSNFLSGLEVWEEEKKFAFELLEKTIKHNEELTNLIQPNLRNWEMDRVAVIDLIMMKMAICELMYFPTVPIKVSINEYIDISKFYSTPKSKDFVNGVLDKVKAQLQEQGAIKKHGRGLLE